MIDWSDFWQEVWHRWCDDGSFDMQDLQVCLQEAMRKEGVKKQVVSLGAALLEQSGGRPLLPVERHMLEMMGSNLVRLLERTQKNVEERRKLQKRIDKVAKSKSLAGLRRLTPANFEYWTGGYFQRHGFRDVMVTSLSADFGIDVLMKCPGGDRAVVQCKRYKKPVSRPVVQQTYGAMKLTDAKMCYVVTTSRFSQPARELAQHDDIVLLDGPFLVSDQVPPGANSSFWQRLF